MHPPKTPLRGSNGDNGVSTGHVIRFTLDGDPFCARAGQTVAAALWAQGRRVLRRSPRRGEPRGLFCAMGVCFECVVQIDGRPGALACQTIVSHGMRVETEPSGD